MTHTSIPLRDYLEAVENATEESERAHLVHDFWISATHAIPKFHRARPALVEGTVAAHCLTCSAVYLKPRDYRPFAELCPNCISKIEASAGRKISL